MKALLCLGKLALLRVIGKKVSVRKKWLAWDGRNLHICTVSGTVRAKLPSGLVAKHRKFHRVPPQGLPFKGDAPTPKGKLTHIGLLRGLVYTVPRQIRSPEKNPYRWDHKFGDTGHNGGDYPESVMPMLMKDSAGNLFIRRRKGNIYSVDEWIRG